jgi:hypothetical protein
MGRRTHLKAWDKRLLARIHRGRWSVPELEWVLAHLDERTPTLVIQEIHAKISILESQKGRDDATTESPSLRLSHVWKMMERGLSMTDEDFRDTFHRVELRLERLDTHMGNLEKSREFPVACGESTE